MFLLNRSKKGKTIMAFPSNQWPQAAKKIKRVVANPFLWMEEISKKAMIGCGVLSLGVMMLIIFPPIISAGFFYLLFFMLGLITAAQSIGYPA